MSDEAALLAAIIANRDEDTPRLMYADWLQENGQTDRAEFIRVQIELARLEAEEPPECSDPAYRAGYRYAQHCEHRILSALLDNLGPCRCAKCLTARAIELLGPEAKPGEVLPRSWDWFSAPYPWVEGRILHRGFIDQISCPASAWVAHGDEILQEQPIRHVQLTTFPDGAQDEDQDEGEVWLQNDPAGRRIAWADVLAERQGTERYLSWWPAFLRLRWPGVEFTIPVGTMAGFDMTYQAPEGFDPAELIAAVGRVNSAPAFGWDAGEIRFQDFELFPIEAGVEVRLHFTVTPQINPALGGTPPGQVYGEADFNHLLDGTGAVEVIDD